MNHHEHHHEPGPVEVMALEAYGVAVAVRFPQAVGSERITPLLPPGWKPCPPTAVQKHFGVVDDGHGKFEFYRDDNEVARGITLDHALTLLEAQVRAYVALHAPAFIFVHAGVVAYGGKAIVLPGLSFAGKTTLVAALIRAGAIYYSDEFAVLDKKGFVLPYGKPLSVRNGGIKQTDHDVATFGGVQGDEALRIGAIVVTRYRPGASWEPRQSSVGEGVIALLANTVAAQDRPHEVMRFLTRAADGAVVVESDRGDADELAPALLALVESAPAR